MDDHPSRLGDHGQYPGIPEGNRTESTSDPMKNPTAGSPQGTVMNRSGGFWQVLGWRI